MYCFFILLGKGNYIITENVLRFMIIIYLCKRSLAFHGIPDFRFLIDIEHNFLVAMKRFFCLVTLFFTVAMCSFAVSGIIGIKADNSKSSFALSSVMNIKVVDNGGVSMQVNSKDGSSADGFKTIVFSDAVETETITDMSNANIAVYPNPVEKIIYVTGLENDADLRIVNMDGQVVKSASAQSIEVEDLESGMYVLSINGKVVKFIKK